MTQSTFLDKPFVIINLTKVFPKTVCNIYKINIYLSKRIRLEHLNKRDVIEKSDKMYYIRYSGITSILCGYYIIFHFTVSKKISNFYYNQDRFLYI